jgi:hypothetical protein
MVYLSKNSYSSTPVILLPGQWDRVRTTRVLCHSFYRMILIVPTGHLSVCQVKTSRGNATNFDVVSKRTCVLPLPSVSFTNSTWEAHKWAVF